MKDPYVLVIPPVRVQAIARDEEAWAEFICDAIDQGLGPSEMEGMVAGERCGNCYENFLALEQADEAAKLAEENLETAEADLDKLEKQLRGAGLTPVTVS